MKLGDKLRSLRAVEGSLRGWGRSMTQQELATAMKSEIGRGLSQAYLSQIENGARPHLTHTTRQLLARFFRVYQDFWWTILRATRRDFSLNCVRSMRKSIPGFLPAPSSSRPIRYFSVRFSLSRSMKIHAGPFCSWRKFSGRRIWPSALEKFCTTAIIRTGDRRAAVIRGRLLLCATEWCRPREGRGST